MTLTITPIYAALTALIFLTLSARVIVYRRGNRISLGDAGDKNLLKRMRAQANCAEYAPIGILLILMCELVGAPAVALHLLGAAFVIGRAVHGWGLASTPQNFQMRQIGMILTLTVIALSAVGLLGHALV